MNSFIKLTTRVINKLHIIEIIQSQGNYYLYMSNKNINGLWITAFGSLSSRDNIIQICEKKNKQDYDIISDFIKEIK